MFFCSVCGCRLRKCNKELEYIGVVCSKCYRMSNKRYYHLVDIKSKEKIKYIIENIEKLSVGYISI